MDVLEPRNRAVRRPGKQVSCMSYSSDYSYKPNRLSGGGEILGPHSIGRCSLSCFVVHLRGKEFNRSIEMHRVSCLTPQQDDMHDY